jgi:hypothetical protein
MLTGTCQHERINMLDSTIKRSATIIANATSKQREEALRAILANRTPIAPKAQPKVATPKVVAKPAPKAQPVEAAWRSRKPSKNQIGNNNGTLRQINAMESMLGYRLSDHKSLNNGKPCKFTAGAYSDHYQRTLKPLHASLVAEIKAL